MKKNVILALGFSIVYMLLLVIVFHPVFTIIDDKAIMEVLSGAYTGTPDGHVVYIKYAIAFIISSLYSLVNFIPWYGIFLIACETACIFLILLKSFSYFKTLKSKSLFGIFFLIVFTACTLKGFIYFTYTSVAGLLGATAIFLVLTAGEKFRSYLLPVLVFLLAFCIRSNAAVMLFPVLIFAVILKFKLANIKKIIAAGITFIVLLGGILFIDKIAYSSDEWQYYMDYNIARTQVYETGGALNYNENKAVFQENGISPELNILYKNYYFSFDKDAAKNALMNLAEVEKDSSFSITGTLGKFFGFVFGEQCLAITIAFILAFLTALFYLIKQKKFRDIISLFIMLILILLPWGYMALANKMVLRVGISTFYVGIFFILYLILQNKIVPGILPAVLITAALIFQIVDTMNFFHSGKYQLSASARTEIEKWCERNPDNIYFLTNNVYVDLASDMFPENKGISNCTPLGAGWLSQSPVVKEKLEYFGINDLDADLFEKNNAFIITYKGYDMQELKEYFSSENEGFQMKYVETFTTSEGGVFEVWKPSCKN